MKKNMEDPEALAEWRDKRNSQAEPLYPAGGKLPALDKHGREITE